MRCNTCYKEINPEHLPAACCSHCREVRVDGAVYIYGKRLVIGGTITLTPKKMKFTPTPSKIAVPKELL